MPYILAHRMHKLKIPSSCLPRMMDWIQEPIKEAKSPLQIAGLRPVFMKARPYQAQMESLKITFSGDVFLLTADRVWSLDIAPQTI